MKAWLPWLMLSTIVMSACGDDAKPGDAGNDAQGDAAPQTCDSDDDCNDGLYCNGSDRCNDDGICEHDAIDCDDGIACTFDRCSESAQSCMHIATDQDGDGHPDATCLDDSGDPLGDDCDDADPLRFAGNLEVCDPDHRDEDCNPQTQGARDQDDDGRQDAQCCNHASDSDGAALLCGDDCDDFKASVHPTASEPCDGLDNDCDGTTDEDASITLYPDADRDGHGAGTAVQGCAGRVGLSRFNDDCDDDDVTRHAAQVEICDGVDNDCDTTIDESPRSVAWYLDLDGDGFGDRRDAVLSCEPIDGRSVLATDCNDSNVAVSPRAQEVCDGVDNDCSGQPDFVISESVNDFEDDDGDGVADSACGGGDCDDRDVSTAAGAPEVCDSTDNDCDDKVDENAPSTVWYVDADQDGYGNPRLPASAACFDLPGRASRPGDCDDLNGDNHPRAQELCDATDNDCDRRIDEDCHVVIPRDAGVLMDGSIGEDSSVVAGSGGRGGTGGTAAVGAGGRGGMGGEGGSDAGDAGDSGDDLPADPLLLDGNAVTQTLAVDEVARWRFDALMAQRVSLLSTGPCRRVMLQRGAHVLINDVTCSTYFVDAWIVPGDDSYVFSSDPEDAITGDMTISGWVVPNDPVVDTTLDSTNNVPLLVPGNNGSLRFTGMSGQRISISAGPRGCARYQLLSPSAQVVSTDFSCGRWFTEPIELTETGQYTVAIDPEAQASGNYNVELHALMADPFVPATLNSGPAVGTIAEPGNTLTYNVSITTGQRIAILTSGPGCRRYLLLSPSASVLHDQHTCASLFIEGIVAAETGVFTLLVDPDGIAVGNVSAAFSIMSPDATGTATLNGAPTMLFVNSPGQNAIVGFHATAGGSVTLTASGTSCSEYRIDNPMGVTIVGPSTTCGPFTPSAFTITSTGTHQLFVNPDGQNTGTLTVTVTSP